MTLELGHIRVYEGIHHGILACATGSSGSNTADSIPSTRVGSW